MSFRQQFDSGEWRALQLAPFLGPEWCRRPAIAASRPRSCRSSNGGCPRPAARPATSTARCSSPSAPTCPRFAEEYDGYEETIVGGLAAVGRILVGQPLVEVELFGNSLINILGAGMTRARGPYGKQATPEGEQMLTMLEEFLRPRVVFPSEPRSGSAA